LSEAYPSPRRWSDEELETAAVAATTDFVTERQAQGSAVYREVFDDAMTVVRRLFAVTDDLRALVNGDPLPDGRTFLDAARYLDGPPVSESDLRTIVEVSAAAEESAGTISGHIASVIVAGLDRERFPWLFRPTISAPTETERDMAVRWTAALWAVQRSATRRRGEAAGRQEQNVKALLQGHDFEEVPRRVILRVGDLDPGQFCPEAVTGGVKCDVPIRLRNGYLLLIECKVSSSGVNSVKRLNHETGNKAREWSRTFGEQAHTMAVLTGVFRKVNLLRAQNHQNIYLVWERDLAPLGEFLDRAS